MVRGAVWRAVVQQTIDGTALYLDVLVGSYQEPISQRTIRIETTLAKKLIATRRFI
jgi:hypothetical protein